MALSISSLRVSESSTQGILARLRFSSSSNVNPSLLKKE
jgi:hypothetical protein